LCKHFMCVYVHAFYMTLYMHMMCGRGTKQIPKNDTCVSILCVCMRCLLYDTVYVYDV